MEPPYGYDPGEQVLILCIFIGPKLLMCKVVFLFYPSLNDAIIIAKTVSLRIHFHVQTRWAHNYSSGDLNDLSFDFL